MSKPNNQIRVLLVAINHYPEGIKDLHGCESDLFAMQQFLHQQFGQNNNQLHIQTLLNQEATRDRIIDTFLKHFQALEDGDIGLFFYSGHGAQAPAPTVFNHNTSNKMYESIVCYDSRQAGKYDLVDKELSWLIWKVTNNKKVQFTVVLDCCHAGSATRDQDLKMHIEEPGIRHIENHKTPRLWTAFLGAEDYHLDQAEVTVPEGRYVLLAACQSVEKAREKMINNRCRGIFTYSLLKVLNEVSANLNLYMLMQKVKIEVNRLCDDQTPKIYLPHPKDIQQLFLAGWLREGPRYHLVYLDDRQQWRVDLGYLHGMTNEHLGEAIFLYHSSVINEAHARPWLKARIQQIFTQHFVLHLPYSLAPQKDYYAELSHLSRKQVAIHIESASSSTLHQFEAIHQAIEQGRLSCCKIVQEKTQAEYHLLLKNQQFALYPIHELFYSPQHQIHYLAKNVDQLIHYLNMITKWHHIKAIKNSASPLPQNAITLTFFDAHSPESGRSLSDQETLDLQYSDDNEKSKLKKALFFKLRIRNTSPSSERLWISTLFLGHFFNISNQLLPVVSLAPGEESWLEILMPNSSIKSKKIPMYIGAQLRNFGVDVMREYLKLMVSTQAFDTEIFNQVGLIPQNSPLNKEEERDMGFSDQHEILDLTEWRTYDFCIQLIYPS